MAGLDDSILLMSPHVIEPIMDLKVNHLGNNNPRIHTDETLLALSICATTDDNAKRAMEQISNLRGCEVHSTVILSPVDERIFKRLGINLTCEPKYNWKWYENGRSIDRPFEIVEKPEFRSEIAGG